MSVRSPPSSFLSSAQLDAALRWTSRAKGLSPEGLEKLARAGKQVHKTSRRDLAAIVAGKLNGATTVSGTSYIANLVGISVFATGGIGGVHRGGEISTLHPPKLAWYCEQHVLNSVSFLCSSTPSSDGCER